MAQAILWVAKATANHHNGEMPRTSTAGLFGAALILASAAHAEPVAPTISAETYLRYAGYVAGLNVFSLHVKAALAPERYRMETRYNPEGVLNVFISGELHTLAHGGWHAGRATPARYQTWGVWRGETRDTQIDYAAGSPLIRKLIPPIAGEREPVTPADQAGTIDTLSAFAYLAQQVNTTGRCDGDARLFDGRRLSVVSAVHVGEEFLTRESRSSFSGPATRCDISGKQIAGFLLGDAPTDGTGKTSGSVWFARPATAAVMLPVRMTFVVPVLGNATLYLTTNPK